MVNTTKVSDSLNMALEGVCQSLTATLPEGFVSADKVFGEQSRLVADRVAQQIVMASEAAMDNVISQLLLVVLLILYLYILFFYKDCLAPLFKVLFRGSLYIEDLLIERSSLFLKFLRESAVVGCLLTGLLLIRSTDYFNLIDSRIIDSYGWLIPIVSIVMIFSVVVYRRIVIRLVGVVNSNPSFFLPLTYTGRLYWVIWTLIATPIFVLGANGAVEYDVVLLNVIFLIGSVLILLYLYRSCFFFILQKVSILQWILYLCVVEIFPLSLFVLMGRSSNF